MGTRLADTLKQTKKTLFSFELLPPPKGQDVQSIYRIIDPLMEYDPVYINVTYHQEEVVYKKLNKNLVEKRTIWKRPGTVAISAAIKFRYKVTVVPHLICGGFTREETENALIDLSFLDIDNILVIRGDPNSNGSVFIPEEGGHAHAEDLVRQVVDMNHGIYLDPDLAEPMPTNFSVGVAGYPEKHPESPNFESDLHFLKRKIDAGAEFIVTQMFFDNEKFYAFEKKCREAGITVPIIPGLKPVTSQKQLSLLPKTFSIDLPEILVKEMLKCKKPEDCYQLGIEWTTEQTQDLIRHGVPVVHFYTMGRADNICAIAKASF
ncbi:MAG: methylenetetrahydrofolate reductase [NAD(P)H] [Chlorobi bacterium]|nr:methylenetetrahydrofolate reductase [NAD(P)H] [Chlorobiota bacterium]